MRVGVRDTQAVACLTINSRHTAGGRARKLIVYDALVHQIFIARRYASAVYILCDSPVSVRPCVWLGAEGLSDAKSCRDPRRDVIVHAAYCYRRTAVAWSVHPCGLLLQTRSSGVVGPSTRPIAIGAMVEQPGGQRTDLACFLVSEVYILPENRHRMRLKLIVKQFCSVL